MGRINDNYGAPSVLPTWAILPAVLTVIFALLYGRDRAQGGYRIETLAKAKG